MKVPVYDLNGKAIKEIKLPKVFSTELREDLILRAVLSTLSKKRQPYGSFEDAGKLTAAHYHGRRRTRYSMMNVGMARMPRLHGKTVPWLAWVARFVPQARKGRRAHPPKVEKIWEEKINKKERRKAIASAIAATAIKEIVEKRGHKIEKIEKLPVVVENKIEEISKTKELVEFLKKIGLEEELKRIKKKKVRAGKGKMRGRRYKKKKGPLIVIANDKGISRAARNLPGVEVVRVENLNAYLLAPGGHPGRLTIWSEDAIKKLEKLKFGG
ncbi:MAG: 50S ribosomal protein L4 [Candidatus Aenigmarchaeota archaeon ex4484_224]|nr:MAG: 50S ribosomal protein L4 [Candidatus Aenigmarchaeota archaeon ex4484_224]